MEEIAYKKKEKLELICNKAFRQKSVRKIIITYLYTATLESFIIGFSTFSFNEIFQFKYGSEQTEKERERMSNGRAEILCTHMYPSIILSDTHTHTHTNTHKHTHTHTHTHTHAHTLLETHREKLATKETKSVILLTAK
jgi:hypothetical protein